MQVNLTAKLTTKVDDFTGLSIGASWIAVGSQIPINRVLQVSYDLPALEEFHYYN
jgi:hypothetical protein